MFMYGRNNGPPWLKPIRSMYEILFQIYMWEHKHISRCDLSMYSKHSGNEKENQL